MGKKQPLNPQVTIIGCGTPTPLPDRFGSSYVVQVGDEKLLFDCGPATTWKLARAGISTTEIDNVFFTHHHFDHDADFPTFILTRCDQMVPRDRLLNGSGPRLTEEFTNGIIDEDTGLFAQILCGKAVLEPPADMLPALTPFRPLRAYGKKSPREASPRPRCEHGSL